MEESYSFGVLGATGRGAVEHWGITPDQVRGGESRVREAQGGRGQGALGRWGYSA